LEKRLRLTERKQDADRSQHLTFFIFTLLLFRGFSFELDISSDRQIVAGISAKASWSELVYAFKIEIK
jgi:hypothetical protein